MRRSALAATAALAALASLFVPLARAAEQIDVALTADWSATSIALETLLGVSDVNPNAFWTLVDVLDGTRDDGGDSCGVAIANAAREALESDGSARAMALATGLRAYSPRLASHRALAPESSMEGEDGCCRVEIDGRTYEDVEILRAALSGADGFSPIDERLVTERDRVYGDVFDATLPTALAYASPGTRCFKEMHELLKGGSESSTINYVLRPVLFSNTCARSNACVTFGASDEHLRLAGFGIELAVKNMEYKAIDDSKVKSEEADDDDDSDRIEEFKDESVLGFNFARLARFYKTDIEGLREFRDEIVGKSELTSEAPLKLWDIADLGLQATQRIALSDDPLSALVELSQNFPSLANVLSRMKLDRKIVSEVKRNHKVMQPGGLVMSLNGENLELDTIDIYTLAEIIGKEVQFADSLGELGIPNTMAAKLLRLQRSMLKSIRVNVTSPIISYYNDIEKDAQYSGWSKDFRLLTNPSRGGLPQLGYNLYNLVCLLDPSYPHSWDMIAMMDQFTDNGVPIRMAQVIVTGLKEEIAGDDTAPNVQVGTFVARAANFLLREFGALAQRDFLGMIAANRKVDQPPTFYSARTFSPPDMSTVKKALKVAFANVDVDEAHVADFMAEFASESAPEADSYVEEMRAVIKTKGLNTNSVIFNGEYIPESLGLAYRASLEQIFSHHFRQEVSRLEQLARDGSLKKNSEDIARFVQSGAVPKYVPWLLDEEAHPPVYHAPPSRSSASLVRYAQGGNVDEVKGMSITVFADADTPSGAKLIAAAAKHVQSEHGAAARFTVVHPNLTSDLSTRSIAIQAALQLPTNREKIASFIESLLENSQKSVSDAVEEVGLNADDLNELIKDENALSEVRAQHQRIVAHHGLKTKCAVIANGRVLDLLSRQCVMDSDDLAVLTSSEMDHRSKFVYDTVTTSVGEGKQTDDISTMVSAASAIVAKKQMSASNKRSVESLESIISKAKLTAFTAGSGTIVEIEAILDPLSKEAQRVAPVLALLRERLGDEISIRVVLNPRINLSDLPLKSYYRYVTPPLASGSHPMAEITNIPTRKTLTMHVDFPEAWMVTTAKAAYDLDNIILKDIKERRIYAEYRLESLIVTGHVSDGPSGNPARGTQLVLEDENATVKPGTIVMSNLGYFQLPASPGMHKLTLRSGRSADIFSFDRVWDILDTSVKDRRISKDGISVDVLVDSFRGRQLSVSLSRRGGMEHVDVLDETKKSSAASSGGWLSKVFPSSKSSDERIHIFSVASGHLYERFLKIMMASVKRSTNNPVKFWFIKNWLSPSFKDFLPYMAKEYDFEYELVSYKWPTWLNKQTEKQRIIWAYKILFLDVLFPLELSKVIFVDADQIVRADMKELWNMNLRGAPYGYTPMCDNNKEMEGFRFWKQGFWLNHLRDKPYHISALYVVDLDRFRAIAAGDRLRVMYNSLSMDPNSLANLDQDLPNYAQHDVPIFSLPMPWLWCESWCGNETKSVAKTIDLCNNPLTKEPKLESARRIVAEWPDLDAEVRAFTSQVEDRMRRGEDVSSNSGADKAHDEL